MRSPDPTDVERIEGLLRGVPPESARDAHLEGLIRELRGVSAHAPRDVREQVRSLEPPRGRQFGWKPALVLVPVALALAAGIIVGGRDSGPQREAGGTRTGAVAAERLQEDSRAAAPAQAFADTVAKAGRAQEWDVRLDLAVRDNRALSDASADAIRVTRELGGFVVSSNVATDGRTGNAQLVLRVPQRRVQDAIAQLSELGTITGQEVSVQDRQGDLDRLAARIDTLRIQRAELNAKLAQPGLSEPERLRLELRRQRVQGLLNQLTRQRSNVAGEVAFAEFQVSLATRRAAAAPGGGRFDDAIGSALGVLAVAAAAALFLAIVLLPLAAIVAAALLGRRALRRRDDERLLDRPRPTPSAGER
ncbi:MAG TPA: DUF4349 domain-containing protein [Gaiellaceae bacterium]|nr:DUF4349 domain-containing protein [Gaiellaceae bacterium]